MFFFIQVETTYFYTLSLHDALPIYLFSVTRDDPTVELTRRRKSKHPSPHQATCEKSSRRPRPTICGARGRVKSESCHSFNHLLAFTPAAFADLARSRLSFLASSLAR